MGFRGKRYDERKLADILGISLDDLQKAMSQSVTGAYATIWSVEQVSDTRTNARISISRKNAQTGEYETDFSGFVSFIGSVSANKASRLKERDRIRLGDVDVSNRYDKEKRVEYNTFKVFSFETQDEIDGKSYDTSAPNNSVDSGEIDDSALPF